MNIHVFHSVFVTCFVLLSKERFRLMKIHYIAQLTRLLLVSFYIAGAHILQYSSQ